MAKIMSPASERKLAVVVVNASWPFSDSGVARAQIVYNSDITSLQERGRCSRIGKRPLLARRESDLRSKTISSLFC